ncbi:MAG: hypothetical protein AAF604_04350 [Acidobacteriota bacterium]
MDDRSLVAAYLDGATPAVSRVTTWIERAIGRFRRPLGSDWEDAVQDIQVELLRSLAADRFAGTGPLEAFVSRTARYRVIDRLRRGSLIRWVDVEAVTPFLEDRSALDTLRQGETLSGLLRLYATMPETCRQLWRMIVAGYSYREMSFALDVAEGTLRVRVKRCRDKALASREPKAQRLPDQSNRSHEVTSAREPSSEDSKRTNRPPRKREEAP